MRRKSSGIWWRRKTGSVAKAENLLFEELSKRNLTANMTTQRGFTFDREKEGVGGTVVDYLWKFDDWQYAVFLDGEQIHKKYHQANKDELIVTALLRRGMIVERFTYHAPISDKALKVIADGIEKTLRDRKVRLNPQDP